MSEPRSRAAKRAATAQRVLDAARTEFGERGLEATTIRRIAQRANVDPSLVMQHYGSKAALFAVAIQLGDAAPDKMRPICTTSWTSGSGPCPRRPRLSYGPCSPHPKQQPR